MSSKEEVGVSDSFSIDPVDLNSFFDEDGKIYGYQGLKVIYIHIKLKAKMSVWFPIMNFFLTDFVFLTLLCR